MRRFISDLKRRWQNRPFIWYQSPSAGSPSPPLPADGKVLVLAPHADDPESIAVTSRLLMVQGCDIQYAIASLSPGGVEDVYALEHADPEAMSAISMDGVKMDIRRQEQIRAAELFGLGRDKLTFFGDGKGETAVNPASPDGHRGIKALLDAMSPDIAIMPVGRDANATHRWVHHAFRKSVKELAAEGRKTPVGLYNEDPKTTDIREDLYVVFGSNSADWKGTLLRTHDSQQQRNLNHRGAGFDERILRRNRECYARIPEAVMQTEGQLGYAEVFEIELFDTDGTTG